MVDTATQMLGSPATSPPPSRDLFRQAGLPEISRVQVTVDHVARRVLHHGALVVRHLISRERVHELRRNLDVGATRITPRSETEVTQARMLDGLVKTYEATGILKLVESYVGERPVGMPQRTLVKRNERSGGLTWHQDAAFYRGKWGALSVWTALTACGEHCPGLSVIPRRFETVIDREHRAGRKSERCISAADTFAREVGVASPILEPGDAILFDEMTLHQTSDRRWNVPSRDVAITWFFAPSRFPPVFKPLAL